MPKIPLEYQQNEPIISSSRRLQENDEAADLSSIPRLNRSHDEPNETTPRKVEQNGWKTNAASPARPRQPSSSSESDVRVEPTLQRSQIKAFPIPSDDPQSEVSVDEDLRDLNNHLTEFLLEHDKSKERRKTRKSSNTVTNAFRSRANVPRQDEFFSFSGHLVDDVRKIRNRTQTTVGTAAEAIRELHARSGREDETKI